MRYEKRPFCIFSLSILNRGAFTFLSLIVFSILDDTDLLTAYPFKNKDGTASGLSIQWNLYKADIYLRRTVYLETDGFTVKFL